MRLPSNKKVLILNIFQNKDHGWDALCWKSPLSFLLPTDSRSSWNWEMIGPRIWENSRKTVFGVFSRLLHYLLTAQGTPVTQTHIYMYTHITHTYIYTTHTHTHIHMHTQTQAWTHMHYCWKWPKKLKFHEPITVPCSTVQQVGISRQAE